MSGLDAIKHPRGDDLIASYKERFGDKTLIAFSRGKDSVAVALALRDKIEVIPFYYDYPMKLSFVEESLAYYEKHLFGRRILRMPDVAFNKHLRDGFLQPVRRAEILTNASLPRLDHPDILRMVKKQEGIEGTSILTATGVRALDNAIRFLSIKKHGPIRSTAGNWAPIWHWSKQDLLDAIESSGISLPPDYTFLPRSLDGFSYLFLIPLKERFPEDYQRIIEWLPLAPVEEKRWELYQRYFAQ
ncbi:hypothetical protein [Bradyrhizobium sp. Tv2a-2]|uniref:hypothetical protein n=1 Tax=Bradyrhizobium sp. Tv2a-2 TaxID=113395 RepID=UPI0004251D98|nr:hypothetical protein [Bradyrhizobium sp. Tv2a-2]